MSKKTVILFITKTNMIYTNWFKFELDHIYNGKDYDYCDCLMGLIDKEIDALFKGYKFPVNREQIEELRKIRLALYKKYVYV